MAISDRGLPPGIAARLLREEDLDEALALSQEAGWNQRSADWRIFLELGHAIGLVRDGRVIATAATLPHGAKFAWISMVLVTAPEQRQGLARWLLRQCVEELLETRRVPVLDATPAGRAVYTRLGFQDCWAMSRLIARQAMPPNLGMEPADVTIRRIEDRDWPSIVDYDRKVFGADRNALLRRLAARLPEAALVAEQRGKIAGYLSGRDGRTMSQLGPLMAENETVAAALLAKAMAGMQPPITIDLPDRHAAFGDWLKTLGFRAERPLIRMAYGRSTSFDDVARLFAIAGPELG